MGLLTNSARAVWTLTDQGAALLATPSMSDVQKRERVRELWSGWLTELREARKAKQARVDSQPEAGEPTEEPGWKEQLLGMQPAGFERLAQRFLREADFDSVNVTGKSGDGGSMDWVYTDLAWSASRSSSSASDTAAASAPPRSATSAGRCPAAGTRDC